jgi:hypothetical protein
MKNPGNRVYCRGGTPIATDRHSCLSAARHVGLKLKREFAGVYRIGRDVIRRCLPILCPDATLAYQRDAAF